jgi:HD-GYP domain-containing protein (c-di-GMP phosphodiesterase class II)
MSKGGVIGVLVAGASNEVLASGDEYVTFMDALAGQASMAIESSQSFAELQRANRELAAAYDTALEGWAYALELRDHETAGHTRRVSEGAVTLGTRAGMSAEALVHLKRGAILHDVGKIAVPDAVLLKAGPLTDDERREIQRHPDLARQLLWPIEYLRPAIDIPYCHHEHWDGSGYPRGLRGEEIPLAARLFAVVDVWDALCSNRPYRRAWAPAAALAHIKSLSGTHFDPVVVDLFVDSIENVSLPPR